MDTAITDGAYGRALLQLVLNLPAGIDPVFDRYRVAAMIDHGDWDGLRSASADIRTGQPGVGGVPEVLTANVDTNSLPLPTELHERRVLEIYEFEARRAVGDMKRWARRVSGVTPVALWAREDVAIGRHLRYRQLHDAMMNAIAEAQGGSLEVAYGLAREAQRLGDEAEQLRSVAHDLEHLTEMAMGGKPVVELRTPARLAAETGPSPVGTWELCHYLMPLVALMDGEVLSWFAQLATHISARLASPRWHLQSDAWRIASELRSSSSGYRTEVAGLVARARKATPGLRALPAFLSGYANRRFENFEEAERLARRSGTTWMQISALAWMSALDPRPRNSKRLRVLLELTGWRRPVLVPSEVAADAALGLTSTGERSESILELAITADRPNVTTELVERYLADSLTSKAAQLAAVDALGRIDTNHARALLSRLAQQRDDVGVAAASAAERPRVGLSQREVEVLTLAGQGLTNKQIADKLFLSPHTIARHLANARAKLGASNRAEAAVLLRRPSEVGLRGPGEGT
jgi:DNA-binding CsgD family transcriptional regulator